MFVTSPTGSDATGAIETVTGRYVDVMNPDPDVIDAYDIFWALSRQARFSGHTLSEEIWSVGQHSLLVAGIVQELMREMIEGQADATILFTQFCKQQCPDDDFNLQTLVVEGPSIGYPELFVLETIHHALLHDATEAYLVDLPSPIKRHSALRDVYRSMEEKLNTVIMTKYGIPLYNEVMNMIVKWADTLALQIEASNMMASRGRGWQVMDAGFSPLAMHMMPVVLPWQQVFDKLMDSHEQLLMKRDQQLIKMSGKHPLA